MPATISASIRTEPVEIKPRFLTRKIACEKTEAFKELLQRRGYGELANVSVRVSDGLVVLYGRVGSYYMKQIAQEAIRPLAIGMRIQNDLIVS